MYIQQVYFTRLYLYESRSGIHEAGRGVAKGKFLMSLDSVTQVYVLRAIVLVQQSFMAGYTFSHKKVMQYAFAGGKLE